MHKVAVIVGSIRKDSINRKFAEALMKLAEGKLDCTLLRIDDLPLFNQDDEATPTAAVARYKSEVSAADGILFVTPEHNRSIPAAMKNAVDWATRPSADRAFKGKVAAIAGASNGRISTAIAQQHLRTILAGHFVALLGAPELFLNYKDDLFDDAGNVTDETAKKLLTTFVDNFARLVDAMAKQSGS
jgi:chromate reductase, NAD(P)H dehydrogenase (quinone)